MSETDPRNQDERPETGADQAPEPDAPSTDSTPDSKPEPEAGAGADDAPEEASADAAKAQPEATDDAEPAPDANTEEQADAPAGTSVAEDLAAEALRAAQEAVTNLGKDDSPGGAPDDATADASADADAAMLAMMQQQASADPAGADARPVEMPAFSGGALAEVPEGIDLLSDVNLDVTIELGRTRMYVEDVLKLAEGAVVELDKLAGDPVDIYVNQRHVARGEVLILNDNFCVRINEIIQNQPEAAAG